uniref:Uncharacterized protein n=1 Tax=Oryza glumipatula TaxID=40148 RepID=A0A0D9Y5L3_9ORYZ
MHLLLVKILAPALRPPLSRAVGHHNRGLLPAWTRRSTATPRVAAAYGATSVGSAFSLPRAGYRRLGHRCPLPHPPPQTSIAPTAGVLRSAHRLPKKRRRRRLAATCRGVVLPTTSATTRGQAQARHRRPRPHRLRCWRTTRSGGKPQTDSPVCRRSRRSLAAALLAVARHVGGKAAARRQEVEENVTQLFWGASLCLASMTLQHLCRLQLSADGWNTIVE